MKKQRNPASFVIAGAQDHRARTPWKRAPVTFDQWLAGDYDAYQDQCLEAYWSGFYSPAMDAYREACEQVQQEMAVQS